jgi:hypothetical protein
VAIFCGGSPFNNVPRTLFTVWSILSHTKLDLRSSKSLHPFP